MRKLRCALAALPFAIFVSGCGGAPAEPTTPAAPVSEAPVPASSAASVGAPNEVRCGVDDTPRPVGQRARSVNSLLGIPPELPPLLRAMPPPPSAAKRAPPITSPAQAPLIELLIPRRGTEVLPPSITLGLVGAASPEVCESLITSSDEGMLEVNVELGASAEPVVVRSGMGTPSAFARCVMERACQVKAAPEAASTTLSFPIGIHPPQTPVDVSSLRIDVQPAQGGAAASALESNLAALVSSQANACHQESPAPEAPVNLTVKVDPAASTAKPTPPAGQGIMAPRPITATTMIVEVMASPTGPMSTATARYLECLSDKLKGQLVELGPNRPAQQAFAFKLSRGASPR